MTSQWLERPARVTSEVSTAGLLCAIVLSGCSSSQGPPEPTRPARSRSAVTSALRLPQVRKTNFLNTGEDAHYVDNEACIECHQGQFDSYLQTTHSRAFDEVHIDREPPDAEVHHELSGRSYRVYRKNDQLRHCEFIREPGGGELVIADHPMRYVIGSGNHSRSYLVELDAFLIESPITWYAARQSWEMSPGYEDNPDQQGFSRVAEHGCIRCHVGRVESSRHNRGGLQIHQRAIGCESCHGPGSLHVERHRDGTENADGFDNTIVHPTRLPRERQEAICAQCHLTTVTEANVRGRTIADFRPGLHLSDFCVRFRLESENNPMTVVGHIEQLRTSRCYKMSPEMTCTTCHSMHGGQDGSGLKKPGRKACLNCHTSDACGLEQVERLKQSDDDDCTTCHMPKSATDIPHFAFRHHRIGIHKDVSRQEPAQLGFQKLIPVDDLEHLPELERKRCLGLAYIKQSEKGGPKLSLLYARLGVRMLEEVRKQGVQDPEVDAALAHVYLRNRELHFATDRGRTALLSNGHRGNTRRDAIGALSRVYANQGKFHLAHDYLEELTQFRYDADDHLILSICRHRAGDLAGAIQAARRAVDIRPDRPDLHEALSELYLQTDNPKQSEWHRERSQRLRELLRHVGNADLDNEPEDADAQRPMQDPVQLHPDKQQHGDK